MSHMFENVGAAAVSFTPTELAELTAAALRRAAPLPESVQVFSDVEAPPSSGRSSTE
jgi:hypothetical protein